MPVLSSQIYPFRKLYRYTQIGMVSLLITIPEVAKCLQLGRTKVYELIWREHLPVQKFGRAVRVSLVELQRWLEERQHQ